MLPDNQSRQYWEKRDPQQYKVGRKDARDDIESGLLKIKLQFDGLMLDPVLKRNLQLGILKRVGRPRPSSVSG